MLDLIVKNAKACTSSDIFVCDIGIKNEQIVLLEKNIKQPSKTTYDAKGRYVLPGGIDGHCHIDQPMKDGSVCADNFETGTKSAVFGGTTTVIPFAVQYKGDSLRKVIDDYHKKANGNCYSDYAFHTIIADANKKVLNQELPAIIKDGYSHFKIYMTYDDLKLNDREILDVLSTANKEKAVVMIHAENHECISWLTEKLESEGKTHTKYHSNARPDIVEAEATNRAISLSRLTNTPILFVHISSKEAIDAIRSAQSKGFKILAETCPQYLFLTKDKLDQEDFEGAKFVCSPPPRTKEDQKEVWKAIQNGTFDVFSSDHCPFYFKGKKGKDLMGTNASFSKIPNGCPGLETRLPLLFSEGVLKNKISVNKFVEITSSKPAKIYGLYPKKGSILIGADADLVVWDSNLKKIIKNQDLNHSVDYTPYENMEVNAWPNTVISRGSIIVEEGKLKIKKGHGQFLKSEISDYVY
jgi:dihydropyrimidinase